ncbi:MAG TPA: inorganic phosphate transporter [bacterium]|nr:inorganic phosphate transporter [bacterium]
MAFIILMALSFDFLNGFHDAANSIATVVSTRVLSPGQAVIWAAFFNFVAAFTVGTHVAKTVGKGMVDPAGITVYVILAALLAAILWDLITWYYGLPTSSSHALIGAFGGAAVVHGGWKVLILAGFQKTILFIFLSPILGLILGYIFMTLVFNLFNRFTPSAVDGIFRIGQFFSAAAYSIGHGANDSQKTMGIIVALLLAARRPEWAYHAGSEEIAWWIIVCCYAAMALGTMSGGWRIVKTMGQKITKLKPVGGFCAEMGGAISLFIAASMGVPVSTTHTITGAIIGVGSTTKFSSVRWGVAGRIVWAWILTIPASALVAALFQYAFISWGWN